MPTCIRCGTEITEYKSEKYCSKRCCKLYLKSDYRKRKKDVIAAYSKKYKAENKDKVKVWARAYADRKRGNKPKRLLTTMQCQDCVAYVKRIRELEKEVESLKKSFHSRYWRVKVQDRLYEPDKVAAWTAVQKAVRSGELIRPRHCEFCNAKAMEAHHDDYSKPLEVHWLCIKHHRMVHREFNGKVPLSLDRPTHVSVQYDQND